MNVEELEKDKEEKELMARFGVLENKQNSRILSKMEFLNKIPDKTIEAIVKRPPSPYTLTPEKDKKELKVKILRISSAHHSKERKPELKRRTGTVEPADIILNRLYSKDIGPSIPKRPQTAQTCVTEPYSARTEGPSKLKIVTNNEVKSIYAQKLVKGPTSRKSILSTAHTFSVPFILTPTSARLSGDTSNLYKLPQKDRLNRGLFITTLTTEPNSGSKLEAGSLNFLQIHSPKLSSDAEDSSQGVKSVGSSFSYLPISVTDTKEIKFFGATPSLTRPSVFSATAKSRKPSIGLEIKMPKKVVKKNGRGMSEGDKHLHQVKDWRNKIFKKPPRKISEKTTGNGVTIGTLNSYR